ncbi:GMC family oxidoreductase [Rhizorhabdus argentea]|uniref:GMC family oxidoreductase n=1 Tax=Rhizorhabdus argentea TaxID=1387174 RepID=UPI0030EDE807
MKGRPGWDFILVGGGSAGCVLAERLSADPSVSVLLIEEGPPAEDWLVRMPKGFTKNLANPERATHLVTSQPRGELERPDIWMRGKMLGGSSALNGMVWMRGQPEDYDRYGELGLNGWNWADMLLCFKALEDHELRADDYRGGGGPIRISSTRARTPLAEALLKAARDLGLPTLQDLNREAREGLGYLQVNIDGRGRRVSAARAFLNPARVRPNLTIVTHTRIDRVLFDGKRAIGVEGRSRGEAVRFETRGEVILSAGGLASPLLLQRSGVGDAELLESHGIPVLVDSRDVGANMREHWMLQVQFRLRHDSNSENRSLRGLRLAGNVVRYFLTGKGSLATGPYHIGGFMRSSYSTNRPDAQILFMPLSQDETGRGGLEKEPGLQLMGYQCRPESKGSISITSADPDAPPAIRPNYHADEMDRKIAVEMVRTIRRLAQTSPLSDFIVGETKRTADAQTDAAILDAFARLGQAGYHACGTCRMGADENAVLDDRARVRGVTGLRVVDLSMAPEMVSGNTNAPVMAMAWRASQMILEEHRAKHAYETRPTRR